MQKGRCSRWRGLSRAERRATIAAAALLPLAGAALAIAGAPRTLSFVRRSGATTARKASSLDPSVLARAVARASAHGVYTGTCLSRSLTLLWMLQRRGIPADLRFGARTGQGGLKAHAWVEHHGTPLSDPGDYATLTQK